MNNVLEYLDTAAARFPDKTAYTDGKTGLTFSETRQRAQAVGSFLVHAGYRRIPVVVWMGRSPDMAAAFFGAVSAGCAYVPVDSEMSSGRIGGIFADLCPAVVICDEKTRPLLEKLPYDGAIFSYEEMIAAPIDESLLQSIRNDTIDTDLLYIVYTSGSTGKPKGVAACHRSVIDYIESLSPVLGVSEDTVFGNQTPLYVDACLKELYPTLRHGAATVLIPKELFLFPVKLLSFMDDHRINTICWVVSALTILSGTKALSQNPPKHLHTVAFGSELFPANQLALWREALPDARFINLYGPTECTGMSCYYVLPRDFATDGAIPIGKPFPNTRVLLLDGERAVTEPEQEGEICITGTSLTLGYYNDFVKTDASFVQNPLNRFYRELIYRTGDMGCYNSDGQLVFKSRRDHQIKHMGHRIELGEVETAAAMEGVVRAACIFDPERKKIVLFYTGTAAPAGVMTHLKGILPRFACPNLILPLDKLPLTANGKIDRTALAELYKADIE